MNAVTIAATVILLLSARRGVFGEQSNSPLLDSIAAQVMNASETTERAEQGASQAVDDTAAVTAQATQEAAEQGGDSGPDTSFGYHWMLDDELGVSEPEWLRAEDDGRYWRIVNDCECQSMGVEIDQRRAHGHTALLHMLCQDTDVLYVISDTVQDHRTLRLTVARSPSAEQISTAFVEMIDRDIGLAKWTLPDLYGQGERVFHAVHRRFADPSELQDPDCSQYFEEYGEGP